MKSLSLGLYLTVFKKQAAVPTSNNRFLWLLERDPHGRPAQVEIFQMVPLIRGQDKAGRHTKKKT